MNGKGILGAIFTTVTWLILVLFVVGMFMSQNFYWAERVLYYIPHMAIVLLISFLFTKGLTRFLTFLLPVVMGVVMMMPMASDTSVSTLPYGREKYTVMYYNAGGVNPGTSGDYEAVKLHKPDVLILSAADAGTYSPLGDIRNLYSFESCNYKGQNPEANLMVLSKVSLKCMVKEFEGSPFAIIKAPDKKEMYIINAPIANTELGYTTRNLYLAKVIEEIDKRGMVDRMAVGTFSVVPYSGIMRNLVNSINAIGMTSNYKATYYPARVKEDYILNYHQDIMSEAKIMDKLSSRHKPLWIDWN